MGGFRKSRFVGIVKTQLAAYMVGAAYNGSRFHGAALYECRKPLPQEPFFNGLLTLGRTAGGGALVGGQ